MRTKKEGTLNIPLYTLLNYLPLAIETFGSIHQSVLGEGVSPWPVEPSYDKNCICAYTFSTNGLSLTWSIDIDVGEGDQNCRASVYVYLGLDEPSEADDPCFMEFMFRPVHGWSCARGQQGHLVGKEWWAIDSFEDGEMSQERVELFIRNIASRMRKQAA
jgi:hypothetical protein